MELKWLKDFVALGEYGSFSKAAEKRYVTQPAFSRRIRALENWLGSDLVDREQYPLKFTPEGELFIDHAKQLITQIYTSRSQVRNVSALQLQLVVLSQHSLAVSFFPRWIKTLEALAGGALVRMRAGNLHDAAEKFLSGAGDFLLCYASDDVSDTLQRMDVECLPVGRDALLPVSAVNSEGAILHDAVDDEGSLKILRYPPDAFLGRMIEHNCLSQMDGRRIQPVYESALAEGLKALVLQGYGAAWLPKSLMSHELERGALKRLSRQVPSVELQIVLYRIKPSRSAAAEQFWHYLCELYDHSEKIV